MGYLFFGFSLSSNNSFPGKNLVLTLWPLYSDFCAILTSILPWFLLPVLYPGNYSTLTFALLWLRWNVTTTISKSWHLAKYEGNVKLIQVFDGLEDWIIPTYRIYWFYSCDQQCHKEINQMMNQNKIFSTSTISDIHDELIQKIFQSS